MQQSSLFNVLTSEKHQLKLTKSERDRIEKIWDSLTTRQGSGRSKPGRRHGDPE